MIDYINYNSENNELFEKIKSFNLIYDIQNYVPIYQYFIDATNNKNIQTDKLSLITKDNLDIISISYFSSLLRDCSTSPATINVPSTYRTMWSS